MSTAGDVNKLFVFKSLSPMPSNVLPLPLKQTFSLIILIFLKVKVIGFNPGYPLKTFLLYRESGFYLLDTLLFIILE